MIFLKLLLVLLLLGIAVMIWRSKRQQRFIKNAKRLGLSKNKSASRSRP
jgi:hypothetical protein